VIIRNQRNQRVAVTLRHVAVAVSTIAVLLASAGTAAAASLIQIDFDFTAESVMSLLGGTIVTPPDGSFDSGSVRLWVDATDIETGIVGGEVAIGQGAFSGTVAKNVAGAADISGPFSGTQVGTLLGVLDAGATSATFVDDLMIDLNFNLACTGVGCDPLGFPVNVMGISAFSLGTISITGLDIDGTARVEITTDIELDGVLGTLNLVGNEIARIFVVPEPQTATLLMLGLVGLACKRTRRR
jgi:hypothetical protein